MQLTVEEARRLRVCRLCGQPIPVKGTPMDAPFEFGEMVWPIRVTYNFGAEYAHTDCLWTSPGKAYTSTG